MSRPSRSPRIRALLLALSLTLAAGAPAEKPMDEEPVAGMGPAVAPAGAAGIRAFLDLETGRLLARPPGGDAGAPGDGRLGAHHPLNTYAGDLLEEPLPDGGYMVDLQGRFQSAVVATIDPVSGESAIDCVVATAPAEAEDER